MSILEYATSILSIVLGLGVAQLLGGIAWMARNPKNTELFYTFGIWCFAVLLAILGWWWAIWALFRDLDLLTFWSFLPAFLIPMLLYLAARILVPPESEVAKDLDENFPSIATPFCTCLAILFITASTMNSNPIISFEGALAILLIVTTVSGIFVRKPRHHLVVSVAWLCTFLAQQAVQPDIL